MDAEAQQARGIRLGGGAAWPRRLLAASGPGYVIAVGYMDPGNWATDLAGGSAYGYRLLSVVLASSIMAMLLQAWSARLGLVTGRDLAQSCAQALPRIPRIALWATAELGIIACDLAEVIGTAIALKLLFGLPLLIGAIITIVDVIVVLALLGRGMRGLEAFVIALIITVMLCFAIQMVLAQPPIRAVLGGFVPSTRIVSDPTMLYLAIGIIGATVMPHNLYMHSSLARGRRDRPDGEKRAALRWAVLDSNIALGLAFVVNAAILVLAAATFYAHGRHDVTDIAQASHLLAPLLGSHIAPIVFGVALLASGLNSSVTGTLAGQIVMEGFLNIRLRPWLRRLATRGLAVVPVVVVTAFAGPESVNGLLLASQVVLSCQLPFAVFPLVRFVGDRRRMGVFALALPAKTLAWGVAILILSLNLWLISGLL
jgi:manganese transport protein